MRRAVLHEKSRTKTANKQKHRCYQTQRRQRSLKVLSKAFIKTTYHYLLKKELMMWSELQRARQEKSRKNVERSATMMEAITAGLRDLGDGRQHKWGSVEGKRLRTEANHLKVSGNKALKDKKYELAISHYTDALRSARRVSNNDSQLSSLFSNRSYVHCLSNSYDSAVDDATACLKLRPTWSKAFLRLMTALKEKGDLQKAFNVGVDMMDKADLTTSEELNMFVEILSFVPEVENTSKLASLFIPMKMWDRALLKLAAQKSWKIISFLILGSDGSAPFLISGSYKATGLGLSDLVTSCSVADWKSWGQRSTIKLLQAGARMDELSPDGKAAAHAALRVGIRTGVYDLLTHLFLRNIPMGDRDRSDDAGNTLMHLACSETFPTKLRAVKLLLDHNVNPTCRNKVNKRCMDLLPANDPDKDAIIQAMKDKGFERSSVMETKSACTTNHQSAGAKPKKSPEVNPKDSSKPQPSSASNKTPTHISLKAEKPTTKDSADSSKSPLGQDLKNPTKTSLNAEKPTPKDPSKAPLGYDPSSLLSKIYHGSSSRCQIWTRSEVERWIQKNNLTEIEEKLSGLCGPQLSELHLLQLNTPAAFYQLLHDQLHLSLTQLLRVSAAVRNLH